MISAPAVVLTGASRGLGASTALWLAKAGASVALIARSGDALERVASEVQGLGGTAVTIVADVARPASSARAVKTAIRSFGRIDALINNAATVEPLAKVAGADPGEWRACIALDLLAPFYLARAAIPELRKRRGRIVNVSSGAANHPIQAASAYCAAKAALNQFTRVLAAEEPFIVSVSVRPGVVDTAMQALIRQKGPGVMPPEEASYFQDLKDAGRLEPPWVPARSIAWLALHAPAQLSGEFLSYDDPLVHQPALMVFGRFPEEPSK